MASNINIPQGWEIEQENNQVNNSNIVDIPQGWEVESMPEKNEVQQGYISKSNYNPFTRFINCLKWVNNTRLSAYQEGKNIPRLGELNFKDMFNKATEEEKIEMEALSNAPQIDYGIRKKTNFDKPKYQYTLKNLDLPYLAKKGYVSALKTLAYIWESTKAAGTGAVVGAGLGAIAGAGKSLATTKADIIPSTLGGAQIGGSWGAKIVGSSKIAEIETGLARDELRKINIEEIGEKGEQLPDAEINAIALGVGAFNAGLETVGLKSILKTVPAGDKILKYLEKGAVKEIARDKVLREQLTNVMKTYGKGIITETSTEMAQEVTNIIGDRIARGLGKVEQTPLTEDIQRVIDTGIETFGAMVYIGGVGSSAKATSILIKNGKTTKQAKEIVENMTKEEQQEFVENNFDTLIQTIKDDPKIQDSQRQEEIAEVENTAYQKLLKGNVSKEVAMNNAMLVGQFYNSMVKDEASKEKFNEIFDKMDVRYNIPDENNNQINEIDNAIKRLNVTAYSLEENDERINQILDDIRILEDLRDGKLSDNDSARAYELLYEAKNSTGALYQKDNIDVKDDIYKRTDKTKNLTDNEVEQVKKDNENFVNYTNKLINNELSPRSQIKILNKLTTPYNNIKDLKGKKLVINQEVYKKIIDLPNKFNKNHNVDRARAEKLPELVADPLYILQSKSKGKEHRYVVVTKSKGKYPSEKLSVILQPNSKVAVVSSYDEKINISEEKKNKRVLYNKKEELSKTILTSDVRAIDNSNNSVTRFQDNLKSNVNKNENGEIVYTKNLDNQGTFDNSNPNIYFQKSGLKFFNELKNVVQKRDKKVSDFQNMKIFEGVKDYFEIIKDTKVKNLSKEIQKKFKLNDGYKAVYDHVNNTIYLNYDVLNKMNSTALLHAFIHEAEHVRQRKLLNFAYKNRNNSKLTKEEKYQLSLFLKHYEDNSKVIREFNSYIQEKGFEDPEEFDSRAKYLYDKYNKAPMELMADNIALIMQYVTGERNEKEISDRAGTYGSILRASTDRINARGKLLQKDWATENIRRYNERIESERTRLSENPNIFYQAAENKNSSITPVNIDKDSVPDFEKISELKKWIEKELNLIGDITVKSNNRKIQFSKSNISRSMKGTKRSEAKRNSYAGLKELVENSVYGYTKEIDERHKGKLQGQEIYYNAFNYNGENYGIEISVDIPLNNTTPNTYAGHKIKIIKAPTATGADLNGTSNRLGATININDIKELFNPNVNKYENHFQDNQEYSENKPLLAGYDNQEIMEKYTELQEQMADLPMGATEEEVKNIQAKLGVLSDAMIYLGTGEIPRDSSSISVDDLAMNTFNIMYYGELQDDAKDRITSVRRTYNDLVRAVREKKENKEAQYYGYYTKEGEKSVITIMSGHNASTMTHELGHLFLNALNEMAQVSDEARDLLNSTNKWLGSNGNYTVSQAEKFARSFEAYLYKGKAPNSKLRTVFEQFKNWLKNVYEYVTSIPDADISEEAQEIFDRMFGGDEYYKEVKQVNELLERIKKAGTIKEKPVNYKKPKENELTDEQKEYKKTAYAILQLATGKDKKYLKSILETNSDNISVAKKRDALLNDLDRVEDEISKQNFDPAWEKYFNFEEGKDYEVAHRAFEVLLNKEYKTFDSIDIYEDDFAIEMQKAIDKADKEYKYLIREYKKGNKSVALSAAYDWIKSLNSIIKEDYEERFSTDIDYIDREENKTDIEHAKDRIIKAALEIKNKYSLASNESYKELVENIMKNLSFLTPEDKAKMTVNILDINSVDSLMHQIDNLLDIAKTMQDVNYRKRLELKIQQELKKTKNVKKGARTVGKYDYRTNKYFEALRKLNKKSPEEARNFILEERRFATAEDNGFSYFDKLKNKFLTYKASGETYADTDLMKELYDEIVKIKLAGKLAKSELELDEKITEEKEINELIKILKNKKKAKGVTKFHLNSIGNLESLINGIFNKKIKEKYATEILYSETKQQTFEYEQKKKIQESIADIYNLPKWNWDKKIIEYLAEKYIYSEYRREYEKDSEGNYQIKKQMMVDKELTKMDIIQAYIWSMNSVLEQRLINQFGKKQLENMFEELSVEDVKLAKLMVRTAQGYYPMVNKAFIKKYGVDLPKVECYFPSKVERGSELDLFNEYSSKSLNNSFTKNRTESEVVPMQFANPVQVLFNHIDGVSKFVFMGEAVDRMNLIFKNQEFLKPLIIEKYGQSVYKALNEMLLNITYKAQSEISNDITNLMDNMISNWTVGNIAGKLNIAFKQFISANNYALDMPAMDWTIGFTKALFDAKNTIDYMWKIPYVRVRFGGSYSSEYLKQSIGNKLFSKTTKLKDALTIFLRLGDAGSLIFGGKPYIDYLIKQGKSEKEAIKQFIIQTNRYQQSSAISSLSNTQTKWSKQSMARILSTYKNQQFQYLRGAIDSIISYTNGDMSKTDCAKTIYHTIFLQPFIFSLATSGSLITLATTGDDDDLVKDIRDSIFNLGMDAITGLDIIYKTVLQKLIFRDENVRLATIPLWGDLQREIFKASKKDVEFGDFMHFLGYTIGNIFTGIPLPTLYSEVKGVGTMVTDDVLKGLLMMSGISEKSAGHMVGED